jgi:hypothetical protein
MSNANDGIIRVEFLPNGQVDILHIGMDALFPEIKDRHTYSDDLPKSIRDRLAILAMVKEPHPTTVEDVGTRINQNVFWLDVKQEDIDDNT